MKHLKWITIRWKWIDLPYKIRMTTLFSSVLTNGWSGQRGGSCLLSNGKERVAWLGRVSLLLVDKGNSTEQRGGRGETGCFGNMDAVVLIGLILTEPPKLWSYPSEASGDSPICTYFGLSSPSFSFFSPTSTEQTIKSIKRKLWEKNNRGSSKAPKENRKAIKLRENIGNTGPYKHNKIHQCWVQAPEPPGFNTLKVGSSSATIKPSTYPILSPRTSILQTRNQVIREWLRNQSKAQNFVFLFSFNSYKKLN